MSDSPLVLGIDYGTDSARALICDAMTGEELGLSVAPYLRWAEKKFCDPGKNQYRQHPQDYIDALMAAVSDALAQAGPGAGDRVRGISFDTTGSTPCVVDRDGVPLALRPEFADEPDAMFVLWKDHTAIAEAERINDLNASSNTDYLKYVGGIYSSEWVLAKMAHVFKHNDRVFEAAHAWIEHCDWMPALLAGRLAPRDVARGRCAAGHKALWAEEWGGMPDDGFLSAIEPRLAGFRERFSQETFTNDQSVGQITEEWAARLGISPKAQVGIGAFDCHMGAVGGEIVPNALSRVIGTSTCDIMVVDPAVLGETTVAGICGQVDGSVLPGMVGLEAGQSAFGDFYAWFADFVSWPLEQAIEHSEVGSPEIRQALAVEMRGKIIPMLSEAAEAIPPGQSDMIAVDWINGRRTPDADQSVKAALAGLNLGSDAPKVFRAIVEASCFGSRAIVERMRREGVTVDQVIALGGVAQKSPFVMQTMADILDMPIKVARSEQTCALGAAMFAAVVGGVHQTVSDAQSAMGAGFESEYAPRAEYVSVYSELYEKKYVPLGGFVENTLSS